MVAAFAGELRPAHGPSSNHNVAVPYVVKLPLDIAAQTTGDTAVGTR
jgi:hypothetical protein